MKGAALALLLIARAAAGAAGFPHWVDHIQTGTGCVAKDGAGALACLRAAARATIPREVPLSVVDFVPAGKEILPETQGERYLFAETYRGIPVRGAIAVLENDRNGGLVRVIHLTLGLPVDAPDSVTIPADQALASAQKALGGDRPAELAEDAEDPSRPNPQLVYADAAGSWVLAYDVRLTAPRARTREILVNSRNGKSIPFRP